MNKPFLTDIKTLRVRARQHIEQGAVTEGYRADRETILRILNEALATEIVCVLRYKRHFFVASGIHAQSVAAEFAQHAAEEQDHADRIAERIVQLRGEPNFSPEGLLTRSHPATAPCVALPPHIRVGRRSIPKEILSWT
jgi:bacterioferritin